MTSPLQHVEQELVEHYQSRIDDLQKRMSPEHPLHRELQGLRGSLNQGFQDEIADQFERIEASVAQRNNPLSYLLQTPTGKSAQHRARNELLRQESIVEHLTEELSQQRSAEGRLQCASALRNALAEHADAWSRAHRNASSLDDLRAPGQLLQESLHKGLAEPISPAPHKSASPREEASMRQISVQRLLERAREPRERHLSEEEYPLAHDALELDQGVQASLHEILRARTDRPRETSGLQSTWSKLDQELAEAARNFGAAHIQQAFAAQPAPAPDLSHLAKLRADLFQRQIQAAQNLSQEQSQALRAEHKALAERASNWHQQPGTAQELTQGLQADLQRLQNAPNVAEQARIGLESALSGALQNLHAQTQTTPAPPAQPTPVRSPQQKMERAMEEMQGLSTQFDKTPPSTQINQAISQGASREGQKLQSILAQKLWKRQQTRPMQTSPALSATRVFASDKDAAKPFEAREEQPSPQSMWNQVEARQQARNQPMIYQEKAPQAETRVAVMGRAVESAVGGLLRGRIPRRGRKSAKPAPFSSFRGPGNQGPAPRMSSGMPSNIFADLSSRRMNQVYLPVLQRMGGGGFGMRPRAQKNPAEKITQELANPEALYSVLLGDAGERLWNERPDIAERLEANLKEVAQLVPDAGPDTISILKDYMDGFRTTVESWTSGGQDKGPNQEKHEASLSAEAEASRVFGEQMGGLFAMDTIDTLSKPADLVEQESRMVEMRLRAEKTSVDHDLIARVSKMIGKAPKKSVEAYSGPMSEKIAKEMGANAFTVENRMFLPENSPTALKAHEMVHAIEQDPSGAQDKIAKEEQVAYGVQHRFEQGKVSLQQALNNAQGRMELAKDTNHDPMKLPEEPGGTAGASGHNPAQQVQQHNADRFTKDEQILEALVEAVEDLMEYERALDFERYGDHY